MDEKYDINVHLAQRYENFFQGIETNNAEMITASLENIKVLESDDFNTKLLVIEDDYKKDLESLEKDKLSIIQNPSMTKTLDDVIKTINEAQMGLESLNNTFSVKIKTFLVKWLKKNRIM
jgi:hypothetical protein